MKPVLDFARRNPVWAVSLSAALLALAWTIAHLGARSFWFDELWTMGAASPQTPFSETWAIITADVHPPLYFAGLRLWLGLWGASSEWAARAFNLIALGAAIAGAVWAYRAKVAAPLALWFGLFFTSFGLLWYLQDARMYAYLLCNAFLVCVAVLVYEQRRDQKPTAAFIAATIGIFVIMPFAHWFAVLFAGLVLLGLFGWALLEKRRRYALLFFCTGVTLGALAVGWIGLFFASTLAQMDDYGIVEMVAWQLKQNFIGVVLFATTLNPVIILTAAFGAWVVARAKRPALLILMVCTALIPVIILGISLHTPMHQTRNFVGITAPLTLFAAFGFAALAERFKLTPVRTAAALAATLAISLIIGQRADSFYPLERDQWREAGARLLSEPHCAEETIPVSAHWVRSGVMAARIYGYYGGGAAHFAPVYQGETTPAPRAADAQCPVLLWVAHYPEAEARARGADILGDRINDVEIVRLNGHSLFIERPAQ